MTHSHTTTVRDSQTEWAGLNWPKLERIVSRAQVRIARAAQNGDWKKVTELQRMIVNSFAAKVIAVRDVTSSSGARTPGVDGEIWDTPKKKMTGALSLTKKNYRPKPLRRVYIDKGKGDGSKRPLGIPTIRDRAMQKLYALALDPVAEVTADKRSFGFRKGRSAKDAREYIFDIMASRIRAQWVLEADIKGFFDHTS
jgi:RNA-directed DNA polymerase